MADQSKIEWTDSTWQIVTGCSVVSPACTNCYAMRLAGTRLRNHPSRVGLTVDSKAGPVWTGEVRFNEQWLLQPLQWKKPRRIFVAAHGDLFHDGVQDEWLDKIFAVMALCPQHTFQVLTKRPKRMRAYITAPDRHKAWTREILRTPGKPRHHGGVTDTWWPRFSRHIWLGVTAEDQQRADERIPELLATPAAVRWISVEPMLGAIDLTRLPAPGKSFEGHHLEKVIGGSVTCSRQHDALRGIIGWVGGGCTAEELKDEETPRLDWVVCGGESGPGSRPLHPEWARDLRDQCKAAGVAFHFKQWGAFKPISEMADGEADALYRPKVRARYGESQSAIDDIYGRICSVPTIEIGYGGSTGLDAFHVVETAQGQKGGMLMFNVGKARAGRLLDGEEWSQFPELRA